MDITNLSTPAPGTAVDVVKTPLPFPTLPIASTPKDERPWIQNNWSVIFVVEHIVVFLIFAALLVYYLVFAKTPGEMKSPRTADENDYPASRSKGSVRKQDWETTERH